MSTIKWTDVDLYWLSTGKALTDKRRIKGFV